MIVARHVLLVSSRECYTPLLPRAIPQKSRIRMAAVRAAVIKCFLDATPSRHLRHHRAPGDAACAACPRGLRRDGLRLHVLSRAKVAFIDGPASPREDVVWPGRRAETDLCHEREASSARLWFEYSDGSHGAAVVRGAPVAGQHAARFRSACAVLPFGFSFRAVSTSANVAPLSTSIAAQLRGHLSLKPTPCGSERIAIGHFSRLRSPLG